VRRAGASPSTTTNNKVNETMRKNEELGPKQELLIVKMYNSERGLDNRYSASDCTEAALRGKNIQPLVERIEDTHLYRLTEEGRKYALDLVVNGSKYNPLSPCKSKRLHFVYKIKESGHWKMTVRVEVDQLPPQQHHLTY
jgi:hypothetical protein